MTPCRDPRCAPRRAFATLLVGNLCLLMSTMPPASAYWSVPRQALAPPALPAGLGLGATLHDGQVPDPTAACRRPLVRLLALCRRQPALLQKVSRGVALATAECQHQFAGRRWNCTAARRSLGKILQRDYRETGFVSALMAAGVTYAVTRACSTGELVQCGCDRHVGKDGRYPAAGHGRSLARPGRRRRPQPSFVVDAGPGLGTGAAAPDTLDGDWVWGGCGDNVQFGARKSRAFLDAPDRRRSGHHGLARLHNHGAGRLAVKQLMRRACKCHGLSGSCSLRTCWWRLPAFREVGDRLKDRFDAALRVVPTNDGRSFAPESAAVSAPRRQDLVYAEESPDFCRRDLRVGSLGTQGRVCNASAAGTEGCALLCCGRGHVTRVLRTATSCACRFVWCCEVKCSSCEERRTVHSCR